MGVAVNILVIGSCKDFFQLILEAVFGGADKDIDIISVSRISHMRYAEDHKNAVSPEIVFFVDYDRQNPLERAVKAVAAFPNAKHVMVFKHDLKSEQILALNKVGIMEAMINPTVADVREQIRITRRFVTAV